MIKPSLPVTLTPIEGRQSSWGQKPFSSGNSAAYSSFLIVKSWLGSENDTISDDGTISLRQEIWTFDPGK